MHSGAPIFRVIVSLGYCLRSGFAGVRRRALRAVFARTPFAVLDFAAQASWLARSAFVGRARAIGIARYEAGRVEARLTRHDALRTMSAGVREAWFDERLYAGRERGRDAWPDLQQAARELAERIRQIQRHEPGRPIFLSPFHYLSQYANIYVVDEVRKALELDSISVVSGVPRDVYGDDAAMIPAVRILHTYDEGGGGSRNTLGLRVVRALRRDGVAVLFADVPPFTLAKFPMETVGVSMEGREARVHRGVFRLGAPLDAVLLPFYLWFERGRFGVRYFDPIPLAKPEAPQRLADDIVTARKENYPHWLYAGHPCAYYFAATR
jgi:hypothetical protein